MSTGNRCWSVVAALAVLLLPFAAEAQEPERRATVGAYYFDGWTGKTNHITELLQTEFADRKPVWGWKDDTIEIMQKQIDYCADHGVAFWSFCWYYPEGENKTTPLNNALGEKMSVWYPDRTPKRVEEFVRLGVRWLDEHADKATAQRLLLLYAWNENGEGGYLTPTAADGTEYLEAVERAISVEP